MTWLLAARVLALTLFIAIGSNLVAGLRRGQVVGLGQFYGMGLSAAVFAALMGWLS